LLTSVEIPVTGTADAGKALKLPMRNIEDALRASAAMTF
jgi:hypothetical protein